MSKDIILVPQEPCPIRGVLVPPSVQEALQVHKQHDAFSKEAGGMLLGYRRGSYMEIVDVTRPGEGDKRTLNRFIRQSAQHCYLAIRYWRQSKGHIGHLGEWHTHPEAFPKPSSIDIKEWKRVTQATHENNVFLIQGTASIFAAVAWEEEGEIVLTSMATL